jgi:hypothetical protein
MWWKYVRGGITYDEIYPYLLTFFGLTKGIVIVVSNLIGVKFFLTRSRLIVFEKFNFNSSVSIG